MRGEGKGFRVKLERFFRSRDRGTRLSALKQRGLHRESLEKDSKRAVTEVFFFLFSFNLLQPICGLLSYLAD